MNNGSREDSANKINNGQRTEQALPFDVNDEVVNIPVLPNNERVASPDNLNYDFNFETKTKEANETSPVKLTETPPVVMPIPPEQPVIIPTNEVELQSVPNQPLKPATSAVITSGTATEAELERAKTEQAELIDEHSLKQEIVKEKKQQNRAIIFIAIIIVIIIVFIILMPKLLEWF